MKREYIYRITAVINVETEIIVYIVSQQILIGQSAILPIVYIEIFKTCFYPQRHNNFKYHCVFIDTEKC